MALFRSNWSWGLVKKQRERCFRNYFLALAPSAFKLGMQTNFISTCFTASCFEHFKLQKATVGAKFIALLDFSKSLFTGIHALKVLLALEDIILFAFDKKLSKLNL